MAVSFFIDAWSTPAHCAKQAQAEPHSALYGTTFRLAREGGITGKPTDQPDRRVRADAQRNLDTLLQAAKAVFETAGVDAPVRQIAEQAGVGVGTLYRHFPKRADLIAAVCRREMDVCADLAATLAAQHPPFEALAVWMQRYAAWVATKRGLASALHSGDLAFAALPGYFDQRLRPAFQTLLATAIEAGAIRSDIAPGELLRAVSSLCMSSQDDGHARRMVALLVDGLRYGATPR